MVKKLSLNESIEIEFTAIVDGEAFLKSKIDEIERTAKIDENGKSFYMGDDDIGHIKGSKRAFSGWTIEGESMAAKDVVFKFPRASIEVVIHETAKQLAVMFANTTNIGEAIARRHRIGEDENLIEAVIMSGNQLYHVIDNEPS